MCIRVLQASYLFIKQSSMPDKKTEETFVLAHGIPRTARKCFPKKELAFL